MVWLIDLLIFMILCFIAFRVFGKLWYKMHEWVGIEVGTSRYSLPTSAPLPLTYQQGAVIPRSFGSNKQYQFVPSSKPISKRQSLKSSLSILGIEATKINRMPTQAVLILDEINDKVNRYQAWQQHSQQDNPQATQWLTEKKFVVNRLIEETIPQAVNQYDQIALFHPSQLEQKVHADLTAGELLIDVLQQVNTQMDNLLDELFHEASQQLTTTYRYVKTRTHD